MNIDRNLNLVVELDHGDETIYVHCTPISYDLFRRYYHVLALTWERVCTMVGSGSVSGPRIAAMLLEDVARATVRGPGLTWWDGPDGVEHGLLPEMIRLSNVIAPGSDGRAWETAPLASAITRQYLSDRDQGEVLNQLAFFTVVSLVAPPRDRGPLIRGAATLCGGRATSSSCTEYTASLKMPTRDETTGENTTTSSAPS